MPLQAATSATGAEVTSGSRNLFRTRESSSYSELGPSLAPSSTVHPQGVSARSSGAFTGATNVSLYGSNQFNHAQGSIIHIHNQAPYVTADPRMNELSALRMPPNQPYVSPLPGSQVAQSPVKTYTRLMMLQGNGYPLWNPKPPDDLPVDYTHEGVRIGDVGIVTSDGVFDFVFNIYHPADHPINRGRTPPDFVPFSAYFSTRHDRRRWRPKSQLASPSIGSSIDAEGATYYFQCSGSEGAVLALPEGASRDEARELANFRDYAGRHAIGWYQYLIRRGWEIPNGSLYLITGCDKTASWGTAAFNRTVPAEFRMVFAPERGGTSSDSYCWEESGLQGYAAATILGRTILCRGGHLYFRNKSRIGSLHLKLHLISTHVFLALGLFWPKEPFTRSFWDPKIDALENSAHPPDVINFDLLRRAPDAKLALTHDSEYHPSTSTRDHGIILSSSDILSQVYEKYIIQQSGDVIYLVKRDHTDAASPPQGLVIDNSQAQRPELQPREERMPGERERLLPGPSISPPRYLLNLPPPTSSPLQPPATSPSVPSSEPQQLGSSVSRDIPPESTQSTQSQPSAPSPLPTTVPTSPNAQPTAGPSQPPFPPVVAGPSTSTTRGAYTSSGSPSRGGYGSTATTSGPSRGSGPTSRGRGSSASTAGASARSRGQPRGGFNSGLGSFFSFGFSAGAAGAAAGAAPITVFEAPEDGEGNADGPDDSDDSDSSDSSSDDSDSS